jgi:DNA-binding NtrC family response regulator
MKLTNEALKFKCHELMLANKILRDRLSEKEKITGNFLYEVEQQHILSTLKNNQGNKAKTAKDLGISLKTLYNKLSDYNA